MLPNVSLQLPSLLKSLLPNKETESWWYTRRLKRTSIKLKSVRPTHEKSNKKKKIIFLSVLFFFILLKKIFRCYGGARRRRKSLASSCWCDVAEMSAEKKTFLESFDFRLISQRSINGRSCASKTLREFNDCQLRLLSVFSRIGRFMCALICPLITGWVIKSTWTAIRFPIPLIIDGWRRTRRHRKRRHQLLMSGGKIAPLARIKMFCQCSTESEMNVKQQISFE